MISASKGFKKLLPISIALSLATGLIISAPAYASAVTYSQAFTQNTSPSTTAANAWGTFRTSLTGNYSQITISSSLGPSITVTDATKVNNLAVTLKNWTSSSVQFSETIGSNVVTIGNCGNGPELTIGPAISTCNCLNNPSYITVRPQIGNSNWGGSSTTCGAASQTLTVTFRIPVASVTSFSSAQSSPTKSSSAINYSLTFSDSVSGLTSSDFSNAGTASGCSFSPNTSTGSSFTIAVNSCSEGTLLPRLAQNAVTDSFSNNVPPSATNATTTITIDRTTPTITSVTGPSNATYIPGQSLNFTVNFSETVVVTNTPRLSITIGSTTKFASYLSGSNSTALIFRYTIETQAGLFDTDGITLSLSLDQQNGVIDDLAANRLANTSLTSPNLTSVLVAQVPSSPTIDSINVSNQTLTVNFTPGDSNGSAISNYKYSLNNGSTYTTRSPISTTSPLTITGLTNGTTYQVKIRAVNQAGDGAESLTTSAIPLDDQIPPELISFSTNASDGTYIYGESITITATFSEEVRANSEIVITLNSGSSLALSTNSVSTNLNAIYEVQDGDFTENLAVTSFTITSVKDVVGNDLPSTTLPATNLSTNSTIAIDGIRPTINSSSTSLKNNYSSRVVLYSITFNRAIDLITLNDSLTIPTGWSANISGSADSYVVSLTNPSPSNGAVALVIDLSTIEDLVGNTGSGTQTLTLTLNRQSQVTNWIRFLWGEQLQRF